MKKATAAIVFVALASTLAAGAAWLALRPSMPLPTTNPADLKPLRPGILPGYLPRPALIDSLTLLPPPPPAGSPEQGADDAARLAARPLQGTARWQLASRDAELMFPAAAATFACALGIAVNPETTPHLNMLLRRTYVDAGLATYKAKDKYARARPFVAGNDPTCTPKEEAMLRKDGSYPSGHAALGWAWALVLIELAPDRADALARRGVNFGQSRVVCDVHWQSDVTAGRLVASAVVAQLHANQDFTAQLGAARKEIAAARAAGGAAPVECALEQSALEK